MVHRLVFGFVVSSSSKDRRRAVIVIHGLFCKVKQPFFLKQFTICLYMIGKNTLYAHLPHRFIYTRHPELEHSYD